MKPITKECKCGATFETTAMEGWPSLTTKHQCDECEAKEQAKKAAEIQQRKDKLADQFGRQVDKLTPPRLLTPDTSHPAFNRELWRKVKAWSPKQETPWLGIIGETGGCKTRCAFLRLRQIAIEDAQKWDGGHSIPELDALAITGMEFNRLVVDRYSKAKVRDVGGSGNSVTVGEMASDTLHAAHKVDLLLLDELGKVKPTAGTADEIFSLIDYRSAHNLITIWTSNSKPEHFCKAWPEEYAAPGCGRIVEASIIIMA